MDRRIDHDEEDRESSEYEDMDDEETEEFEDVPTTSHQIQMEEEEEEEEEEEVEEDGPVPISIEYEEVYPNGAADHPHDMVEAEKVYYENEMEDLVYHEIYGDQGNEQHKLGTDKRLRSLVASNASCLVCNRAESEKIRLFKWPKSEDLREQWLHFFRLPTNVLNSLPEPYICCYHFTADTFVMMEDRIFWKMTAVPKYRQRRPGLSEPFPWEPAAKMKVEQQMMNNPNPDSLGYKIRYRMPYNKHKTRNTHQVAVMIPVASPHLYYEFHFNRYGLNGTKFYACLNCRKAKTESGIRDVIRTIHLDGNKFLSQGDPFNGHHFACRPHNIYDYKSTWRPIPGQNGEAHFLDEVVYLDDRGNSLEWDTVTRPGDDGQQTVETVKPEEIVVEERVEEHMYEHFEEEPICEEVIHTEFSIEEAPSTLEISYPTSSQPVPPSEDVKPETKKLISSISSVKCHLCPRSNFSSTRLFVQHLQKHLTSEKTCKRCEKRISCDTPVHCIRRRLCESCFEN